MPEESATRPLPVKPFEGKHARYHLEFEADHSQPRNTLVEEMKERKLKAVLHEIFNVTNRGHDENEMEQMPKWGDKYKKLVDAARENGVDLWAGDVKAGMEVYLDLMANLLGPLVLIPAVARILRSIPDQIPKRKFTRRKFLGNALILTGMASVATTLGTAFSSPTEKGGRPDINTVSKISRLTLTRNTRKNRDEIAAAKLGFIARFYRKPREKPNIGSIYGAGHAHIGQLVEDPENDARMREKSKEDAEVGRLFRFHYNTEAKQWEVYEHHLLDEPEPK